MAKQKIDKKSTEVVVTTVADANAAQEVIEETTETTEEISQSNNAAEEVEAPVVAAPTVRQVKITMQQDHVCNVGGKRYAFAKGKTYQVPEDVGKILTNNVRAIAYQVGG